MATEDVLPPPPAAHAALGARARARVAAQCEVGRVARHAERSEDEVSARGRGSRRQRQAMPKTWWRHGAQSGPGDPDQPLRPWSLPSRLHHRRSAALARPGGAVPRGGEHASGSHAQVGNHLVAPCDASVRPRIMPSGTSVAVAPAAPNCQAEGKTREEALQRLRAVCQEWLADAEITSIDAEVPGAEDGSGRHPWCETAGICADDPTLAGLLREAYQRRDAERQGE